MRILVVEPSREVRSVVAEVLRAFGWDAAEARSATQALEMLAAAAGEIDGVVADVELADRSGVDLARDLRSMAGVPVLLLGDARQAPEGLARGVEYLRKPFTVQGLVEAVHHAVSGPQAAAS